MGDDQRRDRLEQVDGGGEPDRADHDAVAGVAADREQDHGDPADDHDGEPGTLLESHARYFGPDAGRGDTRVPMTPPVDAPSIPDAAHAVEYLEEVSRELRGCAILSEDGEVLAASGDDEAWGEAGRELVGAADAAAGEPVAHAHVATGDGEAFCVREGGYVAIAVTERFTLASLMIFDLRNALRRLASNGAVS
jgi:hypothetical protein